MVSYTILEQDDPWFDTVADYNFATSAEIFCTDGLRQRNPTTVTLLKKEKNQCPREGMFSVSFAKARGRDEG